MERVAALMDEWAAVTGEDDAGRARGRAAAFLHDALRDAAPDRLRPWLRPPFRDLPGEFLHGPATVVRLEAEGVDDRELLDAICYHTLGHPRLSPFGRMLMAADFLERGRRQHAELRTALRDRMPAERDAVVREIVRFKVERSLGANASVRPEMIGLWNALLDDDEAG
jgi:HD superfamily phosphohydrolase YqeK